MCDVSDNVPPETVANYLHAAIEADRTFYTIHVVEPLQKSGAVAAAENWRAKKECPPAAGPVSHGIQRALSDDRHPGSRYRLISLWPINPLNAPRSAAEKVGLESLLTHPERVATGTVKEGERDLLSSHLYRPCRESDLREMPQYTPLSAKKYFKLKEAMGDLVIEIPIGR